MKTILQPRERRLLARLAHYPDGARPQTLFPDRFVPVWAATSFLRFTFLGLAGRVQRWGRGEYVVTAKGRSAIAAGGDRKQLSQAGVCGKCGCQRERLGNRPATPRSRWAAHAARLGVGPPVNKLARFAACAVCNPRDPWLPPVYRVVTRFHSHAEGSNDDPGFENVVRLIEDWREAI